MAQKPLMSFTLLWWGHLFAMMALEMSGPFWLIYLKELPSFLDKNVILWSGLLYAAPVGVAIFSTPLWARLGDKVGHKPMLLRAIATLALTQALIGFTTEPYAILGLRLFQGACAGVVAAAIAYIVCFPDIEEKGRALTKIQAATAAGSLLGPLLGGKIASLAGYIHIFQVSSLICMFVMLVFLAFLPAVQPRPKREKKEKKSSSKLGNYSLLLLVVLLSMTLIQCAKVLSFPFLGIFIEKFETSNPNLIGIVYASSGLGTFLFSPLAGRFLDAFGNVRTFLSLSGLSLLSAVLFYLQLHAASVNELILWRFLWGICLSFMLPALYNHIRKVFSGTGFLVGLGNSSSKLGHLSGYGLGAVIVAGFGIVAGFISVTITYLILSFLFAFMGFYYQIKRVHHEKPA